MLDLLRASKGVLLSFHASSPDPLSPIEALTGRDRVVDMSDQCMMYNEHRGRLSLNPVPI